VGRANAEAGQFRSGVAMQFPQRRNGLLFTAGRGNFCHKVPLS